jgi:hypothetical protein
LAAASDALILRKCLSPSLHAAVEITTGLRRREWPGAEKSERGIGPEPMVVPPD